MERVIMVNDQTDLCYSTEERLWYFQKYTEGGATIESKGYKSQDEAWEAWKDDRVEWE